MKLIQFLAVSFLGAITASVANAAPQNYWHDNGFTRLSAANQDGVTEGTDGKLVDGMYQQQHVTNPSEPKYGPINVPMTQAYDAEGLFFKREGNRLFIGLQSGFDLENGNITWNAPGFDKKIYAGDIAISFKQPGASSVDKPLQDYAYGVDFGLKTNDWGDKEGEKINGVPVSNTEFNLSNSQAGVFKGTWSKNTMFSSAAFAIDHYYAVEKKADITNDLQTFSGVDGESFARIVSFDLSAFGYTEADEFSLHAYWTMSCGNDNVWGSSDVDATSEVPVPAAAWLFGSALLGLAGFKRKA